MDQMEIEEERKKKRKEKGCQHQIKGLLTTCAAYAWRGHQGDSNAASKAYVWPPKSTTTTHALIRATNTSTTLFLIKFMFIELLNHP